MVRTGTYKIYGDSISYLIKKSSKSVKLVSMLTDLDVKTLKKCMAGQSVSENVIIKLSDFFGVPISFISDFNPANKVPLSVINDWETYARQLDTDSLFEYFIDDQLGGELLKKNLPLIEEFITDITSAINKNKEQQEKYHNPSAIINLDDKLDKLKRIKDSFSIIDTATEISKNIDICIGRFSHWEFDHSTIDHYGYVSYIAYKKQLIHFQKKSSPNMFYYGALGNVPPSPSLWMSEKE